MTEPFEKTKADRVDIIQTVKTPLGFFTLTVLVVEVVLGISGNLSQGTDRSNLIIGMLILIFLLIVIVAGLAVFRPEALSGKRPQGSSLELRHLSPAEKIVRYRELIAQEITCLQISTFQQVINPKSRLLINSLSVFAIHRPGFLKNSLSKYNMALHWILIRKMKLVLLEYESYYYGY